MDGLIDYIGIDAKHFYENAIMPVSEVKMKYGNRIAILGGVDMINYVNFQKKKLESMCIIY